MDVSSENEQHQVGFGTDLSVTKLLNFDSMLNGWFSTHPHACSNYPPPDWLFLVILLQIGCSQLSSPRLAVLSYLHTDWLVGFRMRH